MKCMYTLIWQRCPIHFIGVWDTVESLVLNAGKRFHNTTLNPEIKYGFHALAIDEKRRDFQPCLWDEGNVVKGQTIEQVWFAGVHADVGGWYGERGLSNITLHWMLGKAIDYRLLVHEKTLATYKCNPHDKMHESFKDFWIFRGQRTREIPRGAKIHESVIERKDNPINSYNPENMPGLYKKVI